MISFFDTWYCGWFDVTLDLIFCCWV